MSRARCFMGLNGCFGVEGERHVAGFELITKHDSSMKFLTRIPSSGYNLLFMYGNSHSQRPNICNERSIE